jgi:hypothetical protein
MPNGRKASTVLVAEVRRSDSLKPSGRVAGVSMATTVAAVFDAAVTETAGGVMKQLT